jgi:hypothetical protein
LEPEILKIVFRDCPSMIVFAWLPPYDVFALMVISVGTVIPLSKYVPGLRMIVSPELACAIAYESAPVSLLIVTTVADCGVAVGVGVGAGTVLVTARLLKVARIPPSVDVTEVPV